MIRHEIRAIAEIAAEAYKRAEDCPIEDGYGAETCCAMGGSPELLADHIIAGLAKVMRDDSRPVGAALLEKFYNEAKEKENE